MSDLSFHVLFRYIVHRSSYFAGAVTLSSRLRILFFSRKVNPASDKTEICVQLSVREVVTMIWRKNHPIRVGLHSSLQPDYEKHPATISHLYVSQNLQGSLLQTQSISTHLCPQLFTSSCLNSMLSRHLCHSPPLVPSISCVL